MGSELLTAMRDSATNLLDEQRRQAADEIVSIGDALRQSGDALEHKAGLGVGRYADEAARAIDDFAGRVRSSSWSEIAADVEDFARRWPIAFLAAAIAVGFVGGRLLLSAPPKPREPDLPRALPGTAVAVETGVRTEISDPYSAAREQG
ncbi:MAG TPA: hypothetical protein VME41_01895 [Stellaceae bacterium]|nr:hypothetical protein [Stellaceae bacterium]